MRARARFPAEHPLSFRRVQGTILIVGDPSRRANLEPRVGALGYPVDACDPGGLPEHLASASRPAVIVLCAADAQVPLLMARLRRNRASAAVPVILCGRLGGAVRDLGDVLELGADHFLEEPVRDEPLRVALDALAGPGPAAAPVEVPPAATREVVVPQPNVLPLFATLGRVALPKRVSEEREGFERVPERRVGAEAFEPEPGAAVMAEREEPAASFATPGEREVAESCAPTVERAEAFEAEEDDVPRLVADHPRRQVPLPTEAEGELQAVEVPRLLWSLRARAFHGHVRLTRGRVHRVLWFDHGRFVHATATLPRDRVVEFAWRSGRLLQGQYEQARRWPVEAAEDEARRLVEAGMLKRGEFVTVLREHAAALAQETFAWNRGTWALDPDASVDAPVQAELTLEQLLLAGVGEHVELPQLWAWLGGPQTRPRWKARRDANTEAALVTALGTTPAAVERVVALDGTRSLAELAEAWGEAETLVFLALLYVLDVLGQLDWCAVPPPSHPVAPEEIDRQRVLERLRLARCGDYFELLGVPRTAHRVEIQRAHRTLARTFAPEQLADGVAAAWADALEEIRAALREACELLSDDALRAAYLAHLEAP